VKENIVKKGVRAGVDVNGVPTNWVWEVARMVEFDDGTTLAVPDSIPFTSEELATHVSAALAAQQDNLAADTAEREALKAQRDVLLTEKASAVLAEQASVAERDALIAEIAERDALLAEKASAI
jgi:hypothetical protein